MKDGGTRDYRLHVSTRPLPSEGGESKVRFQGLPWGIDTFHWF
jgi:hypothetical protein